MTFSMSAAAGRDGASYYFLPLLFFLLYDFFTDLSSKDKHYPHFTSYGVTSQDGRGKGLVTPPEAYASFLFMKLDFEPQQ